MDERNSVGDGRDSLCPSARPAMAPHDGRVTMLGSNRTQSDKMRLDFCRPINQAADIERSLESDQWADDVDENSDHGSFRIASSV